MLTIRNSTSAEYKLPTIFPTKELLHLEKNNNNLKYTSISNKLLTNEKPYLDKQI